MSMARAKTRKPKDIPTTPFPTDSGELHQQGDWLWIPLRSEWRDISAKPEEVVRQRFIRHLVDNYGYELSRMDQERRTMHGHQSPRADIVIWETPEAKAANKTSVLVIECKAENVNINIKDYYQGESYTRAVGCEFFIAHNHRYTAVFKLVPGLPGEFVQINELPKASDWGDAKRIEEIKNRLRAFNRKEFQDLLFDCHSILRDVHKMDPGRSFDTISKILFIKMYVERSGLYGTYTIDFLDRREATRMPNDPAYRNRCRARYGEAWEESHQRIINRAEARTNILELFEIGRRQIEPRYRDHLCRTLPSACSSRAGAWALSCPTAI